MLTAVIWGAAEPRPLALTLATLVPAAIDGALREVVAVGLAASTEARFVAEQAGCRIPGEDRPSSAASDCKGRWLLVVRSGDRVPEEWLEAVLRHDHDHGQAPARIPIARSDLARWRRWLTQDGTALLVSRERVATGAETAWSDLARSVRGRRLRLDPRSAT